MDSWERRICRIELGSLAGFFRVAAAVQVRVLRCSADFRFAAWGVLGNLRLAVGVPMTAAPVMQPQSKNAKANVDREDRRV